MNRRRFITMSATASTALTTGMHISAAQETVGSEITGRDAPMAAAEYLSSLEASDHIPSLYELFSYIHPDAAEVVPRGAMIGWYQADFQSRGPEVAEAYDVTWLDSWTWDVTGKSYSEVTEVSFTQKFANGETINDVVRLKYHKGAWRWWFGRDAEFVEEQIHRFSLIENTPQEGNAPFGLDQVNPVDEDLVGYVPELIYDEETDKQYKLTQSAGSFNPDGVQDPQQLLIYKPVDGTEMPLGSVYFGSIVDSTTDEEDMLRFADLAQNAPPVEFVGWNAAPEKGPAWLHTENAGVDVVGTSYVMTLVMGGNYFRLQVFSESALAKICESIGRKYIVMV